MTAPRFGMDAKGELVFEGESFKPDFIITDWVRDGATHGPAIMARWSIWSRSTRRPGVPACSVSGIMCARTGSKRSCSGLSGGIDSAVVAAMAADAFGPENVHCIMLPYRYTSEESLTDAKDCAARLGVHL